MQRNLGAFQVQDVAFALGAQIGAALLPVFGLAVVVVGASYLWRRVLVAVGFERRVRRWRGGRVQRRTVVVRYVEVRRGPDGRYRSRVLGYGGRSWRSRRS